MADQIFENWWQNLVEPNCGIYYRNQWYSTELDLNYNGYYIVRNRVLYLGESHSEYKYQHIYYLIDDKYTTYSQAHRFGYSIYRSWNRHFINTNHGEHGTSTYLTGYYNTYDGYYVSGVWYSSLQDLNAAGYEVGTSHVYIYGINEFHKFDTITKVENDIKYYFTTDSDHWFTEDEFAANDKSWIPSVETNWSIGYYWASNYGHGGHGSYSTNYKTPYRDGVSQTKELLDSVFGFKPNNTEYDCVGACMTDSMNWRNGSLVGQPLYFEYYYGGTNSRTSICSVYSSYSNAFGSNQDYSSIGVALSKDVEVIKIYDEANFAYNAFKYKFRNVDYYYILDNDVAHDHWITDIISDGYSFTERDGIIQINAVYGDDVKIPRGYDIVKAVGNCINLFPSYVGIEDGTGYLVVAYEGKDWCNPRINPRMIRQYKNIEKGHPVFRIEQIGSIRDDLLPHGQYTDTTAGTDNRNGYLELVDVKVKGTDPVYGDYYVLLKSTSTSYKSYFENGLPARCWMCIGNGWYIHEYTFNEPPDTYSFNKSTATFTWTGDPSDTSDHAYWQYTDYHGASSGDHVYKFFLYAENESDRITQAHLLCVVDGTHKTVEYWPHDGYKMGNTFYNEEELLNLGYIVSRKSRQIVADVANAGESVYACYNVTKNSTSFSGLSDRRHLLTVNGEPLLYDGSADISIDTSSLPSSNNVTYLGDMPSAVTSYVNECVGLYSIITNTSDPYKRFTSKDIGSQLALVICSNYSSDIYYSMPNKVVLNVYDNQGFETLTTSKLDTGTAVTVAYRQDVGYIVKDVGTFATALDLFNAGYLLIKNSEITVLHYTYDDNLYTEGNVVKNQTSFNLSSKYCRPLYRDTKLTIPFMYDGNYVAWDIAASGITQDVNNSKYKVTNLSQFPENTTDDHGGRTDGFFILSETGTPQDPQKISDINKQMKVYCCTNYNSDLHITDYYNCCISFAYSNINKFFYINAEHYLINELAANGVMYYRLSDYHYYTESQLLNIGYTRVPGDVVYVKDANNKYKKTIHNSINGYYVIESATWYLTEQDLNNAGYVIVEVIPFTVDLNDSWIEMDNSSNDQSIISEAGAGYYVVKSNKNRNVHSSTCTMYININVDDTITFKAMERSES